MCHPESQMESKKRSSPLAETREEEPRWAGLAQTSLKITRQASVTLSGNRLGRCRKAAAAALLARMSAPQLHASTERCSTSSKHERAIEKNSSSERRAKSSSGKAA